MVVGETLLGASRLLFSDKYPKTDFVDVINRKSSLYFFIILCAFLYFSCPNDMLECQPTHSTVSIHYVNRFCFTNGIYSKRNKTHLSHLIFYHQYSLLFIPMLTGIYFLLNIIWKPFWKQMFLHKIKKEWLLYSKLSYICVNILYISFVAIHYHIYTIEPYGFCKFTILTMAGMNTEIISCIITTLTQFRYCISIIVLYLTVMIILNIATIIFNKHLFNDNKNTHKHLSNDNKNNYKHGINSDQFKTSYV